MRKSLFFSNKLENHLAAIWIFVHHYNASLQLANAYFFLNSVLFYHLDLFLQGTTKTAGVSEIKKRVEDLKGIQGAQVAYTARINTESVIALSATLVAEKI